MRIQCHKNMNHVGSFAYDLLYTQRPRQRGKYWQTNVNTTTCYYISRNGSHTLCLEIKVYLDFSKGIRNEKWMTNMMYTGGITV